MAPGMLSRVGSGSCCGLVAGRRALSGWLAEPRSGGAGLLSGPGIGLSRAQQSIDKPDQLPRAVSTVARL